MDNIKPFRLLRVRYIHNRSMKYRLILFRKTFIKPIYFVFILFFLVACSNEELTNEPKELVFEDTEFETTDWTKETHGKQSNPNYLEVFNDNEVKRIDIVISANRWQFMLDDMTGQHGKFNNGDGPKHPPKGPPPGGHPKHPPHGAPHHPPPGGPKGGPSHDKKPVFAPAEIFFNGKEWYRVGIRFKGNSSLHFVWPQGIMKLSFKLDFDQFEKEYPQIENQRFYGFKKLSLKNNFGDNSMLREKIASDLFRSAGLASSHTAFYTLYVDYGEGPIYFGLYTLVEEVDDTVLKGQFSDSSGNLYKPDRDAASFTKGSFNKKGYQKKNNKSKGDFSDVEGLLTILHDDSRITNPASWRKNLDSIFDTDVFLKYLAVNTVIQNWDTYGRMNHNYYLYNNPTTKKLTWIPWDNNEALQDGKMDGAPKLDFSDVSSDEWPLIKHLYNDDIYRAKYDMYVQEVVQEVFNYEIMHPIYTTYSQMIEKHALSETKGFTFLKSKEDFQEAINELNSHVEERASAVNYYLKE